MLAKYGEDRGRNESFENGYRNMLKNAVLVFYQAGLRNEALKIYNDLRSGTRFAEFKVSLEQFAKQPHHGGVRRLGHHRTRASRSCRS